jgi:hypothetical protein
MRVDLVVTLTYLVTLAAPFAAAATFRLARAGDHDRHRWFQLRLLALCWLAVLVLEARIRTAGGSGAFLAQAPADVRAWAYRLLIVHISVAVATYLLWTGLAIVSSRRFRTRLPGGFSRTHKRLGTLVFAGLAFTAASATGMYALTFLV